MNREIVFEVLDVLAGFDITQDINEFLPLLVSLATLCEPIRKKYNSGEMLDLKERNTLKVFNVIENAYQCDRLSATNKALILDYLDEINEVLGQ